MGCEPELLKTKTIPVAARQLDLPEGVPLLASLYLYIAGSCNLACRHCWISPTYEPDNSKGQFLKLEYVKKAVTEAIPLGLQSVKLTGGEPMLHPQFREIVDYIESENVGMIMETNGTLIDDEVAAFLKAKKYFNFISVSVDGAKPETHDKMRGVEGSFEKAVSGIKALAKAGFRPQLICTLHKGNVKELEEVIDLAASLGCNSVKFNLVQPMGRGDIFSNKNVLGIQDILDIFQKLDKNISKRGVTIHFDIPMAFHPINKLLKDNLSKCNIINILGILSTAETALCGVGTTIPELTFGHLSSLSLKEIWIGNSNLLSLRKQIPNDLEGICAECIHKSFCLGCCVANNYFKTKKLNAAYMFCQEAENMGIFPSNRKFPSDGKTESLIGGRV